MTEKLTELRHRNKNLTERMIQFVEELQTDIKAQIADEKAQKDLGLRCQALVNTLYDLRRQLDRMIELDLEREAAELDAIVTSDET